MHRGKRCSIDTDAVAINRVAVSGTEKGVKIGIPGHDCHEKKIYGEENKHPNRHKN